MTVETVYHPYTHRGYKTVASQYGP